MFADFSLAARRFLAQTLTLSPSLSQASLLLSLGSSFFSPCFNVKIMSFQAALIANKLHTFGSKHQEMKEGLGTESESETETVTVT